MATSAVDQITGNGETVAYKAPCRLATTEHIAHSGLPVIDGVQTEPDDRILDKDNTDATQRGFWIASSGAWRRARDFDSSRDVATGSRVAITDGATLAGFEYRVTTANPISIGTSDIVFARADLVGQVGLEADRAEVAADRAEDEADRAEAETVLAGAAADLAAQYAADAAVVSGVHVPIYSSKTTAASVTIPVVLSSIQTTGYGATAGRGPANYTKTTLESILRRTAPAVPSTTICFVPMNGPVGTTVAYDLGPDNRSVTTNGGINVQSTHTYYGQNMAYFDGVGDHFGMPANAGFAPTGDFIITCGVVVENLEATRCLFSWASNSTNYSGWRINTNGSIEYLQVASGVANIQVLSDAGEIATGTLYELALCRMNGRWSIVKRDPSDYLNEPEVIATSTDGTVLGDAFTNTFRIGHSTVTALGSMKGWMSQFHFNADKSWEGAEDRVFLPESSHFQSADGAWWLLTEDTVLPEQFGAAGDAEMDGDTGEVTATDDTDALNDAYRYCAITGAELRLKNGYWWTDGGWYWSQPITMRGANKYASGIYIDTDRTQHGLTFLRDGNAIENAFISVMIPSSIQNGQGYNGTCIASGRGISRKKSRHVDETAADYGLRTAPPLCGGSLRNVRFHRRPGGGGHCIVATSRTAGLHVENCMAEGWSYDSGFFGSFVLSHWGYTGQDFLPSVDGVLIEPLIIQKEPDTYTYHPRDVHVSKVQLRNCGRLLNSSASYNLFFDGFEMAGVTQGGTGDGAQIVAHTIGDEADYFAHPDDQGKVYASLVVENGVGWNLEAASPNTSDRALISMSGASTSKIRNVDGTLAKDDPATAITFTPGTIASGGGTVVEDVDVAGVTTADTALVGAWFSGLGDDDDGILSASVVEDGKIRCTFTNNGGSDLILAEGTLNAYLSGTRAQVQTEYTGVACRNIRCHGTGGTGAMLYLRNGGGHCEFTNIKFNGLPTVDGLSIQNWRGPTTIDGCYFPGFSEIAAGDRVSIRSSVFETTNIISVTLGANEATPFAFGDTVTGATSGVEGVVMEVASSTVLRVRLTNSMGEVFSASETLSNGTVSGTVSAVASFTNQCLNIRGTNPDLTLAADLDQYDTTMTVSSISADLRKGDKISYAGGVVYVTAYVDTAETVISITPAPASASSGATVSVDRRSRISIEDTEIIGGYRGLQVAYADLTGRGNKIRNAWNYGMLQDTNANIAWRDSVFSGNGLARVALETSLSTRDYVAGASCGGSFYGDGLAFRDGQFIHANFVVGSNTLLSGSLRDSTFVASGAVGAPISDNVSIVTPLSGGAAFVTSNLTDTAGAAVT